MNQNQFNWIKSVSENIQNFGFLPPVADWIGCQFALESAFGKSRIACVKHNLCGMKVPRVRPSLNTALGGFAAYQTEFDCIIDYVLLLSYNHFGYNQLTNLDCFLAKFKTIHYCDDEDYISSINKLYSQFKSLKND